MFRKSLEINNVYTSSENSTNYYIMNLNGQSRSTELERPILAFVIINGVYTEIRKIRLFMRANFGAFWTDPKKYFTAL